MRFQTGWVVSLLLLFASGCEQSTEPSAIGGTYELRSVNGHSVPYTYPGEGGITVLAGNLEVDPDSAVLHLDFRYGTDEWGYDAVYAVTATEDELLFENDFEEATAEGDSESVVVRLGEETYAFDR